MAIIRLIVLSLAVVCSNGFPSQTNLSNRTSTILRNTIFADERFQGEIFENLNAFDDIELTPSNVAISPYRLPTTTRPNRYTVLWGIDFSGAQPTQTSTVTIQLYATQADVNEIVIHTRDLTITRLILQQNSVTIATTYVEEVEYHFLRITLNEGSLNYDATNPVYYELTIDFNANLRDDMYGIYRSWFRNDPTDTTSPVSWMASTQFQATAARSAFPCYDEPSFKATFDVTIRRPRSYGSWFCTRRIETIDDGLTTHVNDVYHTTPVMSTYLLAIIVAEYGSLVAPLNQDGLLVHEVIARPGAIQAGQAEYANEVGQQLLARMSSHTAYDFYTQNQQLKMTQAAIPDFGAGAMENWGLLTYREAYLLYDENETNSYFKQLIAYILSHEIAHMWFGNLVTCEWWDVLWLNEGFARYYQYFLTYWVEDMGLETRFITEQIHTALLSDSANNPQPLTNPGVGSPAAVSAMFSTISYNKGAAVIRMSEYLLGSDVHTQGLQNYLRGKEFDTALPIDLFEYLEQAGVANNALNYGSNFSFIDYYNSWTEQPGHPVLNVQVDHATGEMTIYQRRFNINTGYSNINNNYIVPITFATASDPDFLNTKPAHIISKAVTVIDRGTTGDEWVIFNKQQTGFYRVNYDDYTWDLIVIALRDTNTRTLIHEYNRAQIVNDVFQFARSGLMTYTRAFNILSFLENETEYAPWIAAMTGFSWLRGRLASSTTSTELQSLNSLIVRWASNVMTSLTYDPIDGESFMRSYLRYQLAPVMCALGVTACLTSASTQFQALRAGTLARVPVDSRNWVYCNGLRQGNAADFNFLWTKFLNENVYTEKILILQTIGCTNDVASLNTLLTNIVTDNYVIRPQDYTTALNSAVSGNEGNTIAVFNYIQNNMVLVANAFGGSLATPLSYVSARLRSEEEIVAFETWATTNQVNLGNAYTNVMNGAQSARDSIAWAEQNRADISSYITNGDDVITSSPATSTASSTVVTTLQPQILEPATPVLPDPPSSATTSFVSLTAIMFTLLSYFIL